MSGAIASPSTEASASSVYEQIRPLIVWLGVGEVAWISWWLLSNGPGSVALQGATVGWIMLMLGWLTLVTRFSRRDVFLNGARWLSNLVGFTIVVTVSVSVFGTVPSIRNAVITAASATPDAQLISIHILRVLAIGTAVKFWQGQLPRHFFLLGTIPDFLFAVSAILLLTPAGNGALSPTFLIAWHTVGAVLFFGPGLSMFFSMPSPLRLFDSKPDASLVFQFPMVLAPNFTVPLFVAAHIFAITKYVVGS